MKKPLYLEEIQVKHYLAYLRAAIKQHGRHAIVGSPTLSAVDSFLSEMGFSGYTMIAGGEISTPHGYTLISHWQNIGYYVYNDKHELVVDAYEALQYALSEDPETYLVSPDESLKEETPQQSTEGTPEERAAESYIPFEEEESFEEESFVPCDEEETPPSPVPDMFAYLDRDMGIDRNKVYTMPSSQEVPLTPETAHVCSGCPDKWCKGCIPDESILESSEEDINPLEAAVIAASETLTEESISPSFPEYDLLIMPLEVPEGDGYMVHTLPVKVLPDGGYSCKGLTQQQQERLSEYLKECERTHPRKGRRGSSLREATPEESRLYGLLLESLKSPYQLRRETIESFILEAEGTLKGYESYMLAYEAVVYGYPDREQYEAEGTLLPEETMYSLYIHSERYPYLGTLYGPYLRAYYDVKVSPGGEIIVLSSWCTMAERQRAIAGEQDED